MNSTTMNSTIVVLMGVSGAGKTTVGKLLAAQAHATFADADDYHPDANKQKLAAGIPLDDHDRQPWLETLNGILRGWMQSHTSGVLACSALKASYRETLAHGLPPGTLVFCLLDLPRADLEARLEARSHAFMNPALLDSQLQTLEAPADAIIVENDLSPDRVAAEILRRIRQHQGAS